MVMRSRIPLLLALLAVCGLAAMAGSATATATPSPPTHPVVTVRSATALDLSWAHPVAGSAVRRFEVVRDGRVVRRVGNRRRHVVIGGLAPRSSHRLAVRSVGYDGARSGRSRIVRATTLRTRPARWIPTSADTWHIQYAGTIDMGSTATVYDLDYESTTRAQVAALHAAGKHVVCYIDAGTWESYRPDARAYPRSVLGRVVDGWPDERWVDMRRLDGPVGRTGRTLRHILVRRIDVCAAKGFDGVDPDWQHGFQERTGFRFTAADQLRFNRFLAATAHARGLAAGLKNDKEQTAAMVRFVDFGVDEECQQWNECIGPGTIGHPGWSPFVSAGKPVLAIEYTDQRAHCAAIPGIHAILKHRNLDAWHRTCPV